MILQATSTSSFATLTLIVLYYTNVPLLAYAQYVPHRVSGLSSAFIENQAMYITGGCSNFSAKNWTFLINFNQEWGISAPVYPVE
jgi:hypothetical protein